VFDPSALLHPVVTVKALFAVDNNSRGADSTFRGVSGENREYHIKKSTSANQFSPLSESLGYWCSNIAQVKTPTPQVVRLPDGEFAFGSEILKESAPLGKLESVRLEHCATLSRIYVVDCLLHNEDRHLANYLIDLRDRTEILAIDFGRSVPFGSFPPPAPPPRGNTNLFFTRWMAQIGFDNEAASDAICRLTDGDGENLNDMLERLPQSFFSGAPALLTQLVEWWETERLARLRRIAEILDIFGLGI
jgi:hypothetical protein